MYVYVRLLDFFTKLYVHCTLYRYCAFGIVNVQELACQINMVYNIYRLCVRYWKSCFLITQFLSNLTITLLVGATGPFKGAQA